MANRRFGKIGSQEQQQEPSRESEGRRGEQKIIEPNIETTICCCQGGGEQQQEQQQSSSSSRAEMREMRAAQGAWAGEGEGKSRQKTHS